MGLRVLQVHNRYRSRGGEDVVADQEREALRTAGVYVERLEVANGSTVREMLAASVAPFWSRSAYRLVRSGVEQHQADVVHVHNTHAQLGHAAFFGARDGGAAVVWTAHNFRTVCSNALLLRDGGPCECCLGGNHLNAVRHACYRDSRAASAVMAASLFVHQRLHTIERGVDRILCVSAFVRDVLMRGGIDPDKLIVKPNVVEDLRSVVPTGVERDNRFVFVGRLALEKGVHQLIDAWRAARLDGWTLRIIGDGPERSLLEEHARDIGSVRFDGWLERAAVAEAMARARFLVAPSLWYETYALGVTEAQSLGTPAIAPAHGPFLERIRHGASGLLYTPGSSVGLSETLSSGCAAVLSNQWMDMSQAARTSYVETRLPNGGSLALMDAYEAAVVSSRARRR